jgi:hypothetical protein
MSKITNMAQETALDWFVNSVFAKNGLIIYAELIEQAKAMEKEQIMKAVYDSMGTNFDPNMGRAEQYYNETYNK